MAERAGVDRKTARRCVAAAAAAGLTREAGVEALTDELVGAVVEAVRPADTALRGSCCWFGRSRSASGSPARAVKSRCRS